MLIILDKKTKVVKENMGTNSKFPDGNIPNLNPKENELFIRIHDNSDIAKQIMSAYDYELVLNENNEVTNVIVNKTLEEFQAEQPTLPQPPSSEERLQALEDAMIALTLGGM